MSIRAYADNVIIKMHEIPQQTESGLAVVQHNADRKGHRKATVLASGPGFVSRLGALIVNETKPGDVVLVDALAGQNYDLDLTVPRHNKSSEFQELFGVRGEFRIVREQEILGVIEG